VILRFLLCPPHILPLSHQRTSGATLCDYRRHAWCKITLASPSRVNSGETESSSLLKETTASICVEKEVNILMESCRLFLRRGNVSVFSKACSI